MTIWRPQTTARSVLCNWGAQFGDVYRCWVSVWCALLQAQTALKSVQQEAVASADNSASAAPASTAAAMVTSNIAELSQVNHITNALYYMAMTFRCLNNNRCWLWLWLKKAVYSFSWKTISKLLGITCHMGSHNVTCHPTQVNAPRLNPSQLGRYLIYLPWRGGRLSWPR